VQGKSRWS